MQTSQINVSTLGIELARFHMTLRFTRPFLKMDSQGNDFDIALGAGTRLTCLSAGKVSWLSSGYMRTRQVMTTL